MKVVFHHFTEPLEKRFDCWIWVQKEIDSFCAEL